MENKALANMSSGELTTILAERKEELRQIRFKTSQGQFSNVKRIMEIKKTIARILTILNNKTAYGKEKNL